MFAKVSIITVVYNAKSALERTIKSVTKVKYPNLEYIIVDGGSTDGTRSVIESNYLIVDRWISEPDKGIYDAMNKGLSLATGEYVWFMNAGDLIYDPLILETIFKGSEYFSDLYYGDTLISSPEGEILGLRGKKPPKSLKVNSFRNGMSVCHQSIIVRKSLTSEYNLEYRFSSDIDWVINILKRGASTCNLGVIVSQFEVGGATTKNHLKSLSERWKIMRLHYGLTATLVSHIRFCFNILKSKYRKYND